MGGFIKKTMAEIAYHYAYDSWGKGAATEIAACVMDFGLKELGVGEFRALSVWKGIS